MPLTITGLSGRVLFGRHVVTEIGRWSGVFEEGGSVLHVNASKHRPDPVWWESHGQELTGELDVGRAQWIGRAEIVSREPLAITLREVG